MSTVRAAICLVIGFALVNMIYSRCAYGLTMNPRNNFPVNITLSCGRTCVYSMPKFDFSKLPHTDFHFGLDCIGQRCIYAPVKNFKFEYVSPPMKDTVVPEPRGYLLIVIGLILMFLYRHLTEKDN